MKSDLRRERRNSARPDSSCSTSSTSSCVERLFDITKCAICGNILEEARFLPCHHSFCTKCIQRLMNSGSDEFLCPVDRKVVKIPKHGVTAFELDTRTLELDAIRNELEDGLFFSETQEQCDSSVADIDINLEWVTKGIKDVQHSSAMAQHEVHTMFEKVYKTLKQKEEELVSEIKRKCTRQVAYMQYEKYRLIETKKFQNELFQNSSDDCATLGCQECVDNSTNDSSACNNITCDNNQSVATLGRSALQLSISSCHIGHQHLEFTPCNNKVEMLKNYLENLGSVSCDFDLNIKLDRDLWMLEEHPCGMEIIGSHKDMFDWLPAGPTAITKDVNGRLLVASRDKNEIAILDNSFNVERVICGEDKFKSIADIATSDDAIYIADSVGCQIVLLNREGDVIKHFGKQGTGTMELNRPSGVTVDSSGRVLVTDSLNHRVKILSSNLQKCLMSINGREHKDSLLTSFNYPSGVATDRDDSIYICDTNNKRVVVLSKDGKFIREICPAGLNDPKCVAVTSDYKVLITDRENCNLMICDMNSEKVVYVSGISNSDGDLTKFKQVHGIVVDGTDKIIVADVVCNSVFLL